MKKLIKLVNKLIKACEDNTVTLWEGSLLQETYDSVLWGACDITTSCPECNGEGFDGEKECKTCINESEFTTEYTGIKNIVHELVCCIQGIELKRQEQVIECEECKNGWVLDEPIRSNEDCWECGGKGYEDKEKELLEECADCLEYIIDSEYVDWEGLKEYSSAEDLIKRIKSRI